MTLSMEGGRLCLVTNESEYPDLTYRITFGSEKIRDFIKVFDEGPPLPPMNWGNSLRAI